jgi:hypothetical protein
MSERAKYLGRKAEKGLRLSELRTSCDGLVAALRDNLDPTLPVEQLPGEIIASQAVELANKILEMLAVRREIARIEEVLGR